MGEFPNKETQFSSENQPEKNGRPPGKSFKAILDALLDLAATEEDLEDSDIQKVFADKNQKVTNREILLAKMMIRAKRDPDSKSAERLMNRVEGKPIETIKQQHEINTDKSINLSIDGKEIDLGK